MRISARDSAAPPKQPPSPKSPKRLSHREVVAKIAKAAEESRAREESHREERSKSPSVKLSARSKSPSVKLSARSKSPSVKLSARSNLLSSNVSSHLLSPLDAAIDAPALEQNKVLLSDLLELSPAKVGKESRRVYPKKKADAGASSSVIADVEGSSLAFEDMRSLPEHIQNQSVIPDDSSFAFEDMRSLPEQIQRAFPSAGVAESKTGTVLGASESMNLHFSNLHSSPFEGDSRWDESSSLVDMMMLQDEVAQTEDRITDAMLLVTGGPLSERAVDSRGTTSGADLDLNTARWAIGPRHAGRSDAGPAIGSLRSIGTLGDRTLDLRTLEGDRTLDLRTQEDVREEAREELSQQLHEGGGWERDHRFGNEDDETAGWERDHRVGNEARLGEDVRRERRICRSNPQDDGVAAAAIVEVEEVGEGNTVVLENNPGGSGEREGRRTGGASENEDNPSDCSELADAVDAKTEQVVAGPAQQEQLLNNTTVRTVDLRSGASEIDNTTVRTVDLSSSHGHRDAQAQDPEMNISTNPLDVAGGRNLVSMANSSG